MNNVAAKAEDLAGKLMVRSMITMNGAVREGTRVAPAVFTVMMLAGKAMAWGETATEQAITGVLNILYLITNVIGVIFVLVGLVRLVIAHSQEDAPGQQKAAMFIGTGIALILIRVALGTSNPAEWINQDMGG